MLPTLDFFTLMYVHIKNMYLGFLTSEGSESSGVLIDSVYLTEI